MTLFRSLRTRCRRLFVATLTIGAGAWAAAAELAWQPLPLAGWTPKATEVTGLKGEHRLTVAFPRAERTDLAFTTPTSLPAGVYRLRLSLRPSHGPGAIGFHGGLEILADGSTVADLPAVLFARPHEPELRTVELVHAKPGPLTLQLRAHVDDGVFQAVQATAAPPKMRETQGLDADAKDEPGGLDLAFAPSPTTAFYFILVAADLARLGGTARITALEIDKVRYTPGETLRGSATLAPLGAAAAPGTLRLYLEHGLQAREQVAELPVNLAAGAATVPFTVKLPARELGYALVAEFAAADGAERVEKAEYFTIADNFCRVAIFGGGRFGGHGFTKTSEAQMRAAAKGMREGYGNACEFFAWAEEDMVEMSPATDYWFSGQTSYHLKKQGLQTLIRVAHENGVAITTYGKFIMSGYLGWKTAYDYPADHKGQYMYPVGMWEGVNCISLDRFFNKEFTPYEFRPNVRGDRAFDTFWGDFLPINPDPTPRMARIAAEEVARSIAMFDWDGIRWDGHPRGGGQCGGDGTYDYYAARRTQALVRYFKDIVGEKNPRFRHGYNYLMVQETPSYDWAREDFELDELCRGGGLLMNESIGNTTAGKSFEWLARNLQVEGDLARERGGFLLGISYADTPRDQLVETALYFASGCRPMGGTANDVRLNRYATRYADYVFDETLRRLATPETILAPTAASPVWWQSFVYETPRRNGAEQLVVNLLNIPRQARTQGNKKDVPVDWTMNAGAGPLEFALHLPETYRVTAAHLLDPSTLAVTPLPVNAGRVTVPPVAVWQVLVLDLAVADGVPALATLCGPPRTFGVPRPDLTVARQDATVLDAQAPLAAATAAFAAIGPKPAVSATAAPDPDTLGWAERNRVLLAIHAANKPETYIKGWWKGGTLPADLELKDGPRDFGNLTPVRNGRLDVFHGRGPMDYCLRLPEILAGTARFQVHDAPLGGIFRAGGGQYLVNAEPYASFAQYDLLVYTGIPHCAIGVENSYALVAYVKAGGAVLFTGGEYAFGKGGYEFTVLERELLPVVCSETVDTVCLPAPAAFEPGPDFAELNVKLDFAAKPAFWVYNRVALKGAPGVKVFLKSGPRPVLVGWQLGQGRVACLLVDHRGTSADGVTAFFDWAQWPDLARAVIAWLAPQAYDHLPRPVVPGEAGPASVKELCAKLEGAALEDVTTALTTGEGTGAAGGLIEGDHAAAGAGARRLNDRDLIERRAIMGALLARGGKEAAAVLVEQLASVANLPDSLRDRVLDLAGQTRPANLESVARRCLAATDAGVRGCGAQLLALGAPDAFAKLMTSPPDAMETDRNLRERCLALGLTLYTGEALAAEGRRRVEEWNRQELATQNAYTGGQPWSLAAPEQPCLDAEALFRRVAWLAYLSRQAPKAYAAQFAREWLMTAQYEDDCSRSQSGLWGTNMSSAQRQRAGVESEKWSEFRARFARLRDVTRPDLERLLLSIQQSEVAAGMARAHFLPECRLAINLLGNHPTAATAPVLKVLTGAQVPLLAEFAKARLASLPAK